MVTRTRFVFLMHPKEFKEEKAGTGRLTHLGLPNSEIHMGTAFDGDEAVQALINDPRNYPVLLYPGKDALNLSTATKLQVSAFSPAATRRDEKGAKKFIWIAVVNPPRAYRRLVSHICRRVFAPFCGHTTWRIVDERIRADAN